MVCELNENSPWTLHKATASPDGQSSTHQLRKMLLTLILAVATTLAAPPSLTLLQGQTDSGNRPGNSLPLNEDLSQRPSPFSKRPSAVPVAIDEVSSSSRYQPVIGDLDQPQEEAALKDLESRLSNGRKVEKSFELQDLQELLRYYSLLSEDNVGQQTYGKSAADSEKTDEDKSPAPSDRKDDIRLNNQKHGDNIHLSRQAQLLSAKSEEAPLVSEARQRAKVVYTFTCSDGAYLSGVQSMSVPNLEYAHNVSYTCQRVPFSIQEVAVTCSWIGVDISCGNGMITGWENEPNQDDFRFQCCNFTKNGQPVFYLSNCQLSVVDLFNYTVPAGKLVSTVFDYSLNPRRFLLASCDVSGVPEPVIG